MLGRLGEKALEGDVAHAYELSGPRSIGKRTVAIRFAQTLLCTSEPSRAGGCGHCLACRKIEHYTHPDVRLVTRLVDIEKETDRKFIAIEQIREMQQDLALRPLEGRWRVVIIDDAAELSEHAEVALLKTLEEPFAQWAELVRDAAVAASGAGHALRPTRERESAALAGAVPTRDLVDLALSLERWRRDVTETTVNARMLLELLVLRVPYAAGVAEAA